MQYYILTLASLRCAILYSYADIINTCNLIFSCWQCYYGQSYNLIVQYFHYLTCNCLGMALTHSGNSSTHRKGKILHFKWSSLGMARKSPSYVALFLLIIWIIIKLLYDWNYLTSELQGYIATLPIVSSLYTDILLSSLPYSRRKLAKVVSGTSVGIVMCKENILIFCRVILIGRLSNIYIWQSKQAGQLTQPNYCIWTACWSCTKSITFSIIFLKELYCPL